MTNEEMAQIIEQIPLAVLEGTSERDVELMMAGHRQARTVAAAFVRDPENPVIE